MNPLDHKKHLAAFARQMRSGKPLQRELRAYLADAFDRIAKGEDANSVLGVKYRRGESKRDANARQNLSLIMHWIAGATAPSAGSMDLEQAFVAAVPLARRLFNDKTGQKYDSDYIKKCWYKADYAHMQSVDRGHFDQDSIY